MSEMYYMQERNGRKHRRGRDTLAEHLSGVQAERGRGIQAARGYRNQGPENDNEGNMLAEIIAVLILVESGGDWQAVGDNGRSWGGLQIQASVVQDINDYYSMEYPHEAAFIERHARNIARLYLLRWVGPDGTPEQYARVWNGGPNGMRKKATLKYWKKAQAFMAKE